MSYDSFRSLNAARVLGSSSGGALASSSALVRPCSSWCSSPSPPCDNMGIRRGPRKVHVHRHVDLLMEFGPGRIGRVVGGFSLASDA